MLFECGGVHEHTVHHYFASAFLSFKVCTQSAKRAAQISNHQCGPACRCIANVYLPKTSGSRCRRSKVVLRRRGVFTHVIIALTPLPYAGPFAIQTKEAPCRFLRHIRNTPLASEMAKPPSPLIAPCYLGGHMFPIENSLLPSQHISLSLWFEPETK